MRVYLSGPISLGGRLSADEMQDFIDRFAARAADLRELGYEVINPCDCEPQDSWENYMRFGLTAVCESDAVAVLPRWLESRGAQLEVFIAGQLGIPVFPVDDLLTLHRPASVSERASRRGVPSALPKSSKDFNAGGAVSREGET